MKKALVISLLVFSFILSSCSSPSSPTPQVDYQSTITSYAVAGTMLEKDNEYLTSENQRLTEENTALQEQVAQLKQQPTQDPGLEQSFNQLQADNAALNETIKVYEDIFYGKYEDKNDLMVLCPGAEKISFNYSDSNSMLDELINYISTVYQIDINEITTNDQKLWSDFDDLFVMIEYPQVSDPYLIIFEREKNNTHNAVFSISFQCYIDFPFLEEKLSK